MPFISCSVDSKPESNCYSQTNPPRNNQKVSIEQGLWGDVWFWSGDFMPVGRGTICQVKREVYVYELTTNADVEQIGFTPFYSAINTNLVAMVESDSDGFFQVELEPGDYSLFVKEDGKFYSNFHSSTAIFPVTINSNQVSEVRFDVTYKATF
ncbi:hypothetical protein FK178_02645 [Antarcticibacterium arcticum]|uniref:Carboxypeptidase regulatory-like domain-containing protein n=1 Tax=Antarcticibacterium arcticum TaxID=2585771 RepID=A0A5B8YI23_9FLAO|nr:hypothetical protein [Antarcticibacterium arcticum]QED36678.1 hypothetical protein FK178_02645 [Antarcticibacterium arcticum]